MNLQLAQSVDIGISAFPPFLGDKQTSGEQAENDA
jgi:hypothetical protein